MRAKASLFLGIVFLFCLSNLSYTQKLSEEDALEGSANLMSPDDEDFNEHSGELPPEVEEPRKSSTFKPHFVTQSSNDNEIIKETVATESPTTIVTSRPTQDAEGADSNHTMILVAIVIIVTVLILLVLVIVCCRKTKSDYEPGTPRV